MENLESLETALRAKFAPKKVATKQEFESWMTSLNYDQAAYNRPLNKTQEDIRREIYRLKIQIEAAKLNCCEIESRKCSVNSIYHELKHEMIMLNPKPIDNEN